MTNKDMKINLGGNTWKRYVESLPVDARALGTVTLSPGDVGALVLVGDQYVQMNQSELRRLPQDRVKELLATARAGHHGGAGRGQGRNMLEDEKMEPVSVMINESRKQFLIELGNGKLSAGVRKAADIVKNLKGEAI